MARQVKLLQLQHQMVPQISPTGEIYSCHHPLGGLARSCNSGIPPCLVDPGHHWILNARDLLLWGENISSGCITLWLFHSKTFWTPMLQHLLTQLSPHTYSPFSQRSKPTSKLAGYRHTWNYSFPPTFYLLGKMGMLCQAGTPFTVNFPSKLP